MHDTTKDKDMFIYHNNLIKYLMLTHCVKMEMVSTHRSSMQAIKILKQNPLGSFVFDQNT